MCSVECFDILFWQRNFDILVAKCHLKVCWEKTGIIHFADMIFFHRKESSQSEEEYPKEKTSSHKKKRHKRSRSKSPESSASESG